MSRPCHLGGLRLGLRAGALSLGLLASACGYTHEQWQAQIDKYDRVVTKQRVSDEKLDGLNADLVIAKDKLKQLQDKVKALGIDLESTSSVATATDTLRDRDIALQEYRLKIKQLEAIAGRYELLRMKFEGLAKLGVEVRVRKNRMVISLPGDTLFDAGKDAIKKEGKELLAKVAAILGEDPALANRDYQVAGHTDSTPLKGSALQDNWALSVMRARQLLLFMIDEKGAKLAANHWSAAGYADTDPIASNETDDGKKANRRCELVLLPTLEEMLDLRGIGSAAPKK